MGVEIGETYKDPESARFTPNGIELTEKSVAKDAGGGITLDSIYNAPGIDVQVILARGGATNTLKGTDGVTDIQTPASIVAAHEVLGHARLNITGQAHGETEARAVENEVRRGRGLRERYNP